MEAPRSNPPGAPEPPSTRAALAALRIEFAAFRHNTAREFKRARAQIERVKKEVRKRDRAAAGAAVVGALAALARLLFP